MQNSNIINKSPYLRTSRDFPEDPHQLSVELEKSYIDIANNVNQRVIGIYTLNKPVVTGESWYFRGGNEREQSLRQVYTFTGSGNIPHGINWNSVSSISPKSYGSYTDDTNWYGLIYGSSVAIAGQLSFYVTPTNIVIQSGSGAPTISSGYINLEWLSQV